MEEAEEVGEPGIVSGFCDGEEEATDHPASEVEGGCLESGCDAPEEDGHECPEVWRDYFPHQGKPFEEDVWDVEDG